MSSRGNITKVVGVSLATTDFESDKPFFIRSSAGGTIKYLPVGNPDTSPITKDIDPSAVFNDPELCKKIFKTGTTATGIFAGFGIE